MYSVHVLRPVVMVHLDRNDDCDENVFGWPTCEGYNGIVGGRVVCLMDQSCRGKSDCDR